MNIKIKDKDYKLKFKTKYCKEIFEFRKEEHIKKLEESFLKNETEILIYTHTVMFDVKVIKGGFGLELTWLR